MKQISKLLFVLVLLSSFSARAQDYKGVWHGYITAEGEVNKSQYALNVKTQEGNIITGKAYLYNNFLFVFLGVFDFIGTINHGNVKITELRITEQELPETHSLCIKFADLNYVKKDNVDYLSGIWNNQKGNCPVADALLKRIAPDKLSSELPSEIFNKIKEDKSKDISFKETILTKPFILQITSPTIEIELKDYMKEDNDTVTVFVNRDEVISRHKITKRTYTKKIRLNKLSGLNEIIVYANNLGYIPPNTCVMIVDDGNSKQRINIFSSKQSSAVIYLNYVPSQRTPNFIPADNYFNDELRKSQMGPPKQ